jgi:hypothetical protein
MLPVYQLYKPSIINHTEHNGHYLHCVSGGCGKTEIKMTIGTKNKCKGIYHCCTGVHDISIDFYSNWMGMNGPANHYASGRLHMISDCYGVIKFWQTI